MKKHFVLLAALALPAILAPAAAFAQQPPPRPGPNEYHGGPPPDRPPHDMPPPEWRKGDRIGPEYRDRQYVIDDWRQYHLSPPPRGHHWVGVSGQYYLVRNSNWAVERIGP
ncbi:RcnB family protein [Paraburkholderia bannensis]|uniref:RcnB family protein n=1 Tax=Paraburkholderia bannensis TaxID=765414 RepID=UPI002AB23D70|nr:RcnB family protein [Paraburkholderia bannensis]